MCSLDSWLFSWESVLSLIKPKRQRTRPTEICQVCREAIARVFEGDVGAEINLHSDFAQLEENARIGCQVCRVLRQYLILQDKPFPDEGLLDSTVERSGRDSLVFHIWEPYTESFHLLPSKREITTSPLRASPVSELSSLAALSNKWISRCIQTHRKCQDMATPPSNDYAMPTRLIDVGSASQPPRLVATSQLQVAPYITLSYCWGTSGKNLRTTKSNLDSMLVEIEWIRLPKTVQDAITFVRALGVRYLWVDALCIVQHEFPGDEGSDWDAEALRMGQYYQHSLCTIAIAGSSDCDQGFLADRLAMKYPIQADELEFKGPDGKSRFFHSPLPSWIELVDDSPLSSRGWCMQERLLSSRVIFFSRHCIFWECVEVQTAEFIPDWGDFKDRYVRARVLNAWNTDRRAELLNSETIPGLHGAWYNFVASYSKKNFTNRADRLVAVASVAGLFEEKIKSAYRAGLWEDSLAFGMCWSSESTWNEVEKHGYTAPTWSWASAEGEIEYESVSGKEFDNWISNIEILNISVTTATGDPKGRVLAGSLRIKGLMAMFCPAEARSRSVPPQPSRYHDPFKVDWDSKAARKLYNKEWLTVFRIGTLGDQGKVYCIVLLIIKSADGTQPGMQQYKRIGIVHWFATEWEGEGCTPLREETIEIV